MGNVLYPPSTERIRGGGGRGDPNRRNEIRHSRILRFKRLGRERSRRRTSAGSDSRVLRSPRQRTVPCFSARRWTSSHSRSSPTTLFESELGTSPCPRRLGRFSTRTTRIDRLGFEAPEDHFNTLHCASPFSILSKRHRRFRLRKRSLRYSATSSYNRLSS